MSSGVQGVQPHGIGPIAWSADRACVRVAVPRRKSALASGIDAGCVAVLVLSVLIEGVVVALGLPHKVELLADAGVALLLVAVLVSVLRGGAVVPIPYLAIAYLVLLAIAAARSDDLVRLVVSLRNFLFWPTLALGLAALGTRERRTRVVLLTAIALAAFEFAVTIVQAITITDVDLVVGTFGDYHGPSVAFVVLAGACLALGVYASGAGRAWWLVIAGVLPLFSIWAAIKIVPFIVPFAFGAVVVAAWWTRCGEPRPKVWSAPPFVAAATAVAATVAVFAGYAIGRPSDFNLFTNPSDIGSYLGAAHESGPAPTAASGHSASGGSSGGGKPSGAGGKPGGGAKPGSAAIPSGGATPYYERGVPGRLTQYKAAAGLVARSPASFLFGEGLGTSTLSQNLGVGLPKERGARLASYTDFGTLLVEVGWAGVAIAALCVLGLAFGSLAAARRAPPRTWTRALLIAYPGVLVTMIAECLYGPPFRNVGSATFFWMLTGLVLASILQQRRRPPAPQP